MVTFVMIVDDILMKGLPEVSLAQWNDAVQALSSDRADEALRVGVQVSKQLTLKFGTLDNATTQRLQGASTTDLERWAERILTANALDDVFR